MSYIDIPEIHMAGIKMAMTWLLSDVSDDVQEPQNDNEAQRHAEQPQDDRHFILLALSLRA